MAICLQTLPAGPSAKMPELPANILFCGSCSKGFTLKCLPFTQEHVSPRQFRLGKLFPLLEPGRMLLYQCISMVWARESMPVGSFSRRTRQRLPFVTFAFSFILTTDTLLEPFENGGPATAQHDSALKGEYFCCCQSVPGAGNRYAWVMLQSRWPKTDASPLKCKKIGMDSGSMC